MLRLFPIKDQGSKKDQLQSCLMIIAALLLITYALVLTLAPAVRYHTSSERYRFDHWLGVAVWFAVFALLHWQTTRKAANRDPYLLPIVGLLTSIGLMMIWRLYPALGLRQTIWLAIAGMVVFLGLQFQIFIDYLRRYKYIWLVLGLILTALTIIFGENPNGAGPALWLQVFGVYFQPSEPLKLLLIAYLAGFFTDRLSVRHRTLETILPTFIMTGLALLLLVSQKDLGTASIFLVVYLALLFTINGDRSIIWITPLIILLAGAVGYFFIDVVRLRLNTWVNPFGDPTGASYQVIQSMIAIAEGGVIGTGPGLGSPSLIPVSVSDFIYSAIAEETGFLGAVLIMLLIIFLIYRGIRIAIQSQNTFHRYLAIGITFYFGIQSILIIGGNIGLLPLTGVTLPFVSYGGSSLVVSFAALLILITISHNATIDENQQAIKQPRLVVMSNLLIGVLIVEILVTSLFSFWFMPSLTNRVENPRWVIDDRFKERGDILDRDDRIIVTNSGSIGEISRINNHLPLYPIIGYTNAIYGQTGIEASLYPYLRGLEGYSDWKVFWQDLIYNQPPEGLDVRLTIDLNFQETADTLLDDTPGSVILMNANSGEILAMASHPYFDAATLEEEWETLVSDENAPLINRATQGLYPAGGSLFPFVLTSQMDVINQFPDPETHLPDFIMDPNCTQPPEGELTWQLLVSDGCQSVQAYMAEMTGVDPLIDLYQTLGFYTEPSLHLRVAEVGTQEISDFDAFFRGEATINISPLQMALAASALTNEGILPAPRIVNGYQDPQGNWITLPKLGTNSQALSKERVHQVTSLLKAPDSPHWQVTASATTEEGQSITWFVAGTTLDWQGQPFTVVVTLEEHNPEKAAEIGKSLLDQAILFAE